jgi:hypothetical protein
MGMSNELTVVGSGFASVRYPVNVANDSRARSKH